MGLVFEKYARKEGGELNDLGTVAAAAGKGGKIGFIRKNFNDATKRIALLITNKEGKSVVVACSEQVTKAIRTKQLKLNQLAGLTIVENEEGHNFVSMPATGAIQSFEIDKIKVEKVEETEGEFLPQELIAF